MVGGKAWWMVRMEREREMKKGLIQLAMLAFALAGLFIIALNVSCAKAVTMEREALEFYRTQALEIYHAGSVDLDTLEVVLTEIEGTEAVLIWVQNKRAAYRIQIKALYANASNDVKMTDETLGQLLQLVTIIGDLK